MGLKEGHRGAAPGQIKASMSSNTRLTTPGGLNPTHGDAMAQPHRTLGGGKTHEEEKDEERRVVGCGDVKENTRDGGEMSNRSTPVPLKDCRVMLVRTPLPILSPNNSTGDREVEAITAIGKNVGRQVMEASLETSCEMLSADVSFTSINSPHVQGRPARFFRRKRRKEECSSSDAGTPHSTRKSRAALSKLQRVEREKRVEAELLEATPSPPTKTGSTAQTERHADPKVRIEASLAAVDKVARHSSNLKGTFVSALKQAVTSIRRDAEELADRTVSEETRALRSENERLRGQVEALQKEMAELRTLIQECSRKPVHKEPLRTSSPSSQLPQLLAELEGRLMRQMGECLSARLANLEPRLNAEPKIRPPLAADPIPIEDSTTKSIEEHSIGEKRKSRKGKKLRAPDANNAPDAVSAQIPPTQSNPEANCEQEWITVQSKRKQAKNTPTAAIVKPAATTTQRPRAKLRAPRSTAVVLTITEKEQTYASVLREAKEKIKLSDLGIEAVKFKRAATGAVILELPGSRSGDKADVLASKLKEIYASGVSVSRPEKCAEVRVAGLDDSVTSDDIKKAIAEIGGCNREQVIVSEVRPDRTGLFGAWVRCPILAAKKITEGRLLIGWVAARVTLLERKEIRCYRCLQSGHVASRCTFGADRSNLCYRCAQPGHRAATCEGKPVCVLCTEAGRKADHRLGSAKCPAPSAKVARRETPRHNMVSTGSAPPDGAAMLTDKIVNA
ncbi:uncharacterized protein LOC123689774 [Pieris rapae]|uniref:uncharacterized protein LOC123689774 n=1 Tax=Pieris rapae TaxID=64459 RepID=UPI001E27A9E1|nr:uncharacterized protein LOC123689774 [Pieris rapae]